MTVDYSELYLDLGEMRRIYERLRTSAGETIEDWGILQTYCLINSIESSEIFLCYNSTEPDPECPFDDVDVVHRAAILMIKLIRNHCLTDGNNRLGWLCAMMILSKSGLTINASNEDARLICKRISNTESGDLIEEPELIRWFIEKLAVI